MARNVVAELVRAAEVALSDEWGPTGVELLDPIRTEWGRHDVIVCNATGPPGTPSTVIVKAPVERPSALFAEWAVHRWLSDDERIRHLVPTFHAGDATTPLIVIGDVGAGPSLKRLLQVPGAAMPAVEAERRLTATVHGLTRGRGDEFAEQRRRLPDGPAPRTPIIDAAPLVAELDRWAVPLSAPLVDEVRSASARLAADDDFACLVFNDACPVNRIVTAHGVVAIDLEHAAFGHPAIDASYPAIGHLACTTRQRPGEAVAWPIAARAAAERIHREAIVEWYPEWHGDRFADDLAAGTVSWLATILHRSADRTVPDERRSPSRAIARSRVISALDATCAVADRVDGLVETAHWARDVRERCAERWPDATPLEPVAGFDT